MLVYVLAASVALTSVLREAVLLSLLFILVILALNFPLYHFFAAQRGWLFAFGAALAHWAYYFYSGAVFVLCTIAHKLRGSPLDARMSSAGPAPLAGHSRQE